MSVSRCDVVSFAFRPAGASFPDQIDGAQTTSGRIASSRGRPPP
jgi:hypothetical protein